LLTRRHCIGTRGWGWSFTQWHGSGIIFTSFHLCRYCCCCFCICSFQLNVIMH